MNKIFAIIGLLALCACATPVPISSNPIQTATNVLLPAGGTVVTGLQNAAFNLDSAVSIQILPPTDPADACVHSALKLIGQDVVLGPTGETPVMGMAAPLSFTPKITDLISGGAAAYIVAYQAKALAGGGLMLPESCNAIIGEFVVKGVNAPANTIIGGIVGALP